MAAVLRLLSRRGEPTRRTRRVIVVFAVLAIAVLGFGMMASPRGAIALVLLPLGAVLLVPLYALQEFRRNVFKRANADERERERRNDAYRLSYRVIEFGVVSVALVFAFSHELARIPGWNWFALWFVAVQYVVFLPYMVFAWREPDAAD